MAVSSDFIVKNGLIVNEDAKINGITVGTAGVATNTVVGDQALSSNTLGVNNVTIGKSSGALITGSNNVILGNFDGNQFGLDITTADTYVVIADGLGNPRLVVNELGYVGINNVNPTTELDVGGTITANNILVDNNLTVQGTSLLGPTTIEGDVTVEGNITATGSFNFTDPVLLLNSDFSELASPFEDAGLEVNRGARTNATFLWDETFDYWTTGPDPEIPGRLTRLEARIEGGTF